MKEKKNYFLSVNKRSFAGFEPPFVSAAIIVVTDAPLKAEDVD